MEDGVNRSGDESVRDEVVLPDRLALRHRRSGRADEYLFVTSVSNHL